MREELDALTDKIIGAAVTVHKELGPGLLEAAYEACLAFELLDRGLHVEREKTLPIAYRGQVLDCGYRIDLLVNGLVVVEVKSIERFDRVHFKQVMSYLRQSRCKVGLLFNFNVAILVQYGLKRLVNDYPDR